MQGTRRLLVAAVVVVMMVTMMELMACRGGIDWSSAAEAGI